MDAAAAAEWRRAVESAYPKLREVFLPAPLLDEALALRDAQRAKAGAR